MYFYNILNQSEVRQLEEERCALQKQYQQLEQQLREAEEVRMQYNYELGKLHFA